MSLLSRLGLWALCVCTLASLSPLCPHQLAQAAPKPDAHKTQRAQGKSSHRNNKSVRRCVRFSQQLGKDEESVDLRLENKCKFEVRCSLTWKLSCAGPGSSATSEPSERSTTLDSHDDWTINASAATCEEDWEVGQVRWNCVAVAS